tara:strand:- start:451 stop:1197 length:747 start_codon:yes stop_codon:yes gene_type:complete
VFLAGASVNGGAGAKPATLSSQQKQGRQLAAKLLHLRPKADVKGTGILKMRDARGKRRTMKVAFNTTLSTNSLAWHDIYRVALPAGVPKDTLAMLVVFHQPGKPNEYAIAHRSDAKVAALPRVKVTGSKGLGGSDFTASDFGLSFLHWPHQRLLRAERRMGADCHVLESINPSPAPGVYRRVVSWVLAESPGIVRAEVYDHDNKLFKVFTPKRLKKIDGRWHLKEMEMRNDRADTRTSITLDRDQALR